MLNKFHGNKCFLLDFMTVFLAVMQELGERSGFSLCVRKCLKSHQERVEVQVVLLHFKLSTNLENLTPWDKAVNFPQRET